MKKYTRWLVAIAACVIPAMAGAQTTAFTYQGQLNNAGSPFDGNADFEFTLWNVEVGGAQLGGPVSLPATPVSDGLFSVKLDFGPAVFDGSRRWLEITVNSTLLSPRQEVTPAPFALFANRPWATSGTDVWYVDGNVGIGTNAPTQMLSVAGTIESTVNGFMFPDGSVQTTASTSGGGFWSASGADIFSNNAGNLGIGISTPDGKLQIAGGPFWTSNFWTKALNISDLHALQLGGGGSNKFGVGTSGNILYHFQTAADGTESPSNYYMTVNPSGNVGLGAIGGVAPAAKLDIFGAGDGAAVLRLSTERPWTFRQAYTGPGTALRFQPDTGLKSFEISGPTGVNVATFHADESNPRVGIGTVNPLSRLDIAASGAGAELLRFSTERPWIFRQIYTGPSTGLQLYSTSGAKNFEITCPSGVNCATFFTQDAAPRVGIGTTTPLATLDVNGTTRTRVLQITGADVAERFPANGETVNPGTVMEIDPDNAGQLRMARDAYNQRVAGVVSGANDFPAGAILGHMPGMEDAPAIALSGRVWVRCDANASAIRPGDLLTTSNTPGHAMRALDRERSHGAVIGKAMTSLESGQRGLVLVLVNLQ